MAECPECGSYCVSDDVLYMTCIDCGNCEPLFDNEGDEPGATRDCVYEKWQADIANPPKFWG